ncbi:MAG: cytochrome C [Gammaproteobacteria bacterium]|nr:cytochrome C [Gammaproteobacteria bacterium]
MFTGLRFPGLVARGAGLLLPAGFVASLMFAAPAWSLPSFAQQTGVGCAQCHTTSFGPALTQFGREFKLNGYTLGGQPSIPLAAMVNANFTSTSKGVPDGAADHFRDNNNFAFSEISGFFAGRISDHFGGLAQVTYSGVDRTSSWDNLDMRFVDNLKVGGSSVLWGLTLNNNPTIQDLWNTTPGWGFPYTSSDLAPTPAAAPLIDGGIAQQVLGLTAYTEIDDWLYLEFGGYQNLSNSLLENIGLPDAATMDHVKGFAPYWRIGLQHEFAPHYVAGGIFGMSTDLYPGNDRSEGTNRYTDFGYDATYQFVDGGPHTWTAQFTYIHEDQNLDASYKLGDSSGRNKTLNEVKFNVHYAYEQTYAFAAGLFGVGGSRNALMYAPDPVDGSANGRPTSQGYVLEADWIPWGKVTSPNQPWMNARIGLQYTGYGKFNGSSNNYDGFGRSASDNNTVFLYLWLAI